MGNNTEDFSTTTSATPSNDEYVITGDFISVSSESQNSEGSRGLAGIIQHCSLAIIAATLLLMPFLFGGVHEISYLSFRTVIFLLTAILVTFEFSTISRTLSPTRLQAKVFWAIAVLFFFLCIHSVIFYLLKSSHPVVGTISHLYNTTATVNLVLEFAGFISLYVITLFWLERNRPDNCDSTALAISNLILISSFLVSLTALSHWFYDSGKLFWTFSPNFEGISNRARWPFVNPNHLGIFLIIPLFLAIGRISQSWINLKNSASKLSRRGKLVLTDILRSVDSQKHSRSIILILLLVLCLGLAIIASLSRNAIFACSICLLLFYLFPGNKKTNRPVPANQRDLSAPLSEPNVVQTYSDGIVRKKSRHRRVKESNKEFTNGIDISSLIPYLNFCWRVIVVVATISIFWFFLGEKGGELFKSRVEYALLYTQDDMRWQLYKDSIQMLTENPVWGIGIGNWAALYPGFMSEGLSGMEPGYLHSDLLQTAIEFGLAGFMLFVIAVFYIAWILMKGSIVVEQAAISSSSMTGFNSRAALFGFIALILSASFEFPFRIPAILGMFAISLALAIYSLDSRLKQHSVLKEKLF